MCNNYNQNNENLISYITLVKANNGFFRKILFTYYTSFFLAKRFVTSNVIFK